MCLIEDTQCRSKETESFIIFCVVNPKNQWKDKNKHWWLHLQIDYNIFNTKIKIYVNGHTCSEQLENCNINISYNTIRN